MHQAGLAVVAMLVVVVAGCTASALPETAAAQPADRADSDERTLPAPHAGEAASPAGAPRASQAAPGCPDPIDSFPAEWTKDRLVVPDEIRVAPPTTPQLGVPMTAWIWCAKEVPQPFAVQFAFELAEDAECDLFFYGTSDAPGAGFGMVGRHDGAVTDFGFGGGGSSIGAHAPVADTGMLTRELTGGGVGATAVGGIGLPLPAGVHTYTVALPHGKAGDNPISQGQALGWLLACEKPFVLISVAGSSEGFVVDLTFTSGGAGAYVSFLAAVDAGDRVAMALTSDAGLLWGLGFRSFATVDLQHGGGSDAWTFVPDQVTLEALDVPTGDVTVGVTGASGRGNLYLAGAGLTPVASLEALGIVHG